MDKSTLLHSIETLEGQRSLLGDGAVDTAIKALQSQLQELTKAEKLEEQPGERKLITVMFADLSGFTAMSAAMDPEDVRNLVNSTFEKLAQVILKYGGFIEKYIGDEIMAMFGAPLSYEDHAERSLHAALEMMEVLEEFNQARGTVLGLHIGINTGKVVTGMIGGGVQQQYGVTGDTVNLAARLKHASTTGEIFVSHNTYQQTNKIFEFAEIPAIPMKGINRPVQLFQLTGKKSIPEPKYSVGAGYPLVGRNTELNLLKTTVENTIQGNSELVSIIGEAGIGKSRLISEFESKTQERIRWVEGRSLSYKQSNSFLAPTEIMARLLQFHPSDNEQERKQKLVGEIQQLFAEQGSEIIPFLTRFLRLPLSSEENDRTQYLPPHILTDKTFQAYAHFLSQKAKQTPLLIAWEDLHWADSQTIKLLDFLLSQGSDAAVMHLLIFRPYITSDIWKLHVEAASGIENYRTINLSALNKDTCLTLMQNMTDIQDIHAEVQSQIINRSQGNPLFVEELTRSFLEYKAARSTSSDLSEWALNLPTTLQGVIEARIDLLEPKAKTILQISSVLGRIFQFDVLTDLLAQLDIKGDFDNLLEELQKKEFVRLRQTPGTEREYIFKHVLTNEVAYNTLLKARRIELHRAAAETFNSYNQEEHLATIAYHYERTDRHQMAIDFLIQAADFAFEKHANEDVIDLLQRAIQKIVNQPEQNFNLIAEVHEKLGDAYELNGQPKFAIDKFEISAKHVSPSDFTQSARVSRKLGISHQADHNLEAAEKAYRQAENLLTQAKERDNDWWFEWNEHRLDLLFLLYWKNNIQAMITMLEEMQPDVESSCTPGQIVRYYQDYLMYYLRKENYTLSDEAMEVAKKMKAFCVDIDDSRIVSLTKFLWAFALLWHNESEQSIPAFKEAIETAKNMGDMLNMMRSINYLAMAYRRTHDVANTLKYTNQTYQMAKKMDLPEYLAFSYANLSWASWKKDEFDEGIEYGMLAADNAQRMVEISGWSYYPFWWVPGWPMVALYTANGEGQAALAELERIISNGQKPIEDDLRKLIEKAINSNKDCQDQLLPNLRQVLERAIYYTYI